MDIQRDVKPKPLWRRFWYVLPMILLAGATVMAKRTLGDASHIVMRDEIQWATVEQGNFRVDIRGIGVLKPQDLRWVSTQVTGRVEQVMVKAGAQVKSGQPMMQLSNPELHRQLETARWEVEATKAEANAAYVMLESQLVDLENSVLEAQLEYQSTKLKLDAETELMSRRGGIISKLDYERTKLSVEQQLQRWQAQQQRVLKMKTNLQATKNAQIARLGLVENNYQRFTDQVAGLTVRSTTDGSTLR